MSSTDFLSDYSVRPNVWDEMYWQGNIREHYQLFFDSLIQASVTELSHKDDLAKKLFMSQGITFTVYNDGEGIEKIFPFDIIPRIITAKEWEQIELGIKQRIKALNIFLRDIYHDQFIIKDGVIPAALIHSCPGFLREMVNVNVPFDIYTHISGIDLIRDSDGSFYVLEDNLRTPSGVSYMLENRNMTYRIFPGLLPKNNVRSVNMVWNMAIENVVALMSINVKWKNISSP
jgi:uncharacterized circularly permuted ATP-grasp superfamily protein